MAPSLLSGDAHSRDEDVRTVRGGVALVLLTLALTIVPPIRTDHVLAVYSIVQSAITIGVPTWLIVRAARQPASVAATGASSP